jgi:hypothetical protein
MKKDSIGREHFMEKTKLQKLRAQAHVLNQTRPVGTKVVVDNAVKSWLMSGHRVGFENNIVVRVHGFGMDVNIKRIKVLDN